MNNPIDYNQENLMNYFNLQPSSVKGRSNYGVEYHKRTLWTKLYSVYKFTLPKNWELNYFRYWLFQYGSIAVGYDNKFGWICSPYTVTKLGLYYQPIEINIYNRLLENNIIGNIGTNSEIIKIMDDYFGLDDIISKYAHQLAEIDKNIDINLMNTSIAWIFEADSKKQGETIKEVYTKATQGNPFIVINKDVMNDKKISSLFPNITNNYIVDKLLLARDEIMNNFLTEIGINNSNVNKKERLIKDEVNSNNQEIESIVSVIYDNIKKSFDRVNSLDDSLNLNVELRYKKYKEVDNNENNIRGL